jgi:hypothetical protein
MKGEAVVAGLPGSSAEKFALRLRDALRSLQDQRARDVSVSETAESIPADAELMVFCDDAPLVRGQREAAAGAILGRLIELRLAGVPLVVLPDGGVAKRWLRALEAEGIPSGGALQRVFLAAGPSELSRQLAERLAGKTTLSLVLPDGEAFVSVEEGWGPRYQAAASGERWLLWTASWHAVEAIAPRADLVIHLPDAAPAVEPPAGRLRGLLSPWSKRYPGIESGLLSRELAKHAHETPVLTLRSESEVRAVLRAL